MFDFFRRAWAKTSGKVTLLVAAALLLAAAVGVVYGVTRGAGDEGFMRRDGVELRWRSTDLPLPCWVESDVPEDVVEAYEAARTYLRTALGRETFGRCLPWAAGEVGHVDGAVLLRVRVGATSHGADTEHRYDRRDGRVLSSTVSVDLGIERDLLRLVLLHELGHVLGLAHDRIKASVMHPEMGWRRWGLTDRDLARLRAL